MLLLFETYLECFQKGKYCMSADINEINLCNIFYSKNAAQSHRVLITKRNNEGTSYCILFFVTYDWAFYLSVMPE